MEVVGVVEREVGGVVVRRCWREACRVSSTRRKGRYLLASDSWVGAVVVRVREGWPLEVGLEPLAVSLGVVVWGVMVEEVVGSASAISMSSEGLAASCCGAAPSSVAEEG